MILKINLEVCENPMDAGFSVFNGHVNEADKLAREIMGKISPKLLARLEEIEDEQNGIMGIFGVEPEQATMIYAGIVMGLVNVKLAIDNPQKP